MKFSVLISVYKKETPDFLEKSLRSILIKQTLIPSEVVLVKDGPLTKDLEYIINTYKLKFPNILRVFQLNENQGLGRALNFGLDKCRYNLVARMDSDDICDEKRFEKQINYFKNNKNIDAVGGSIAEFYYNHSEICTVRKLPRSMEGIKNMIKRRNPINHVTVMFKKDAVIKSGGYKHLAYLEDYYLWIRMINCKCIIQNIDDVLVYVRTGKEMYKRRGNKEYIGGWYNLQKEMIEYKMINYFDMVINMISIIGFIYTPSFIKEFIYKKFLRV